MIYFKDYFGFLIGIRFFLAKKNVFFICIIQLGLIYLYYILKLNTI